MSGGYHFVDPTNYANSKLKDHGTIVTIIFRMLNNALIEVPVKYETLTRGEFSMFRKITI